MKVIEMSGKDVDHIISELNAEYGQDVLYKIIEKKKKFLKEGATIEIITMEELATELKEFLEKIINGMNFNGNIYSKVEDNTIYLNMESENNNILIGKNGKTLKALEIIVKQKVYNTWNKIPKIILNVGNYKEKQDARIMHLAKKIAGEVKLTKQDIILEDMNAYERKIIHNTISEYKNLITESIGEEPHRHIIIKYNNKKE